MVCTWQLMKSMCEMNKRVCEHDKAVVVGFAHTDVTVQVLAAENVYRIIPVPLLSLFLPPSLCLFVSWSLDN